jgi:type I restriction enzyme S subunit
MKLRKDKWNSEPLKSIFKLKSGSALPNHKIVEGECPVYGGNGIVGYHAEFMVKNPTIVIGRVGEYCGSIHLSKPNSWITDNGLYPIEYLKEVDTYFLKETLTHVNLNHYSRKTGQPSISQSSISAVEIPLPPLEEQKQIAALFQSIETAMERVDMQGQHLKALQKSLVDGLLKPDPAFGNLLSQKNCTPTTFGEIADCDKKYPEHKKVVERFVGLEYLEADNFQLQGFGLVANGTTFSNRFAKGDVLFGKRRAYLKKVAVADFDGICSGDILVIRAKAKKMLQELLPFYISSDAFINQAVSTSAGSLSPRTKWKDLADLEVSIPDLKIQERILEVFTQLQTTLQQLKQQKITLKNLKQKLLNEILG